MDTLRSLHGHLLNPRFGLGADDIKAFVEEGRVRSWFGERNENFQVTYKAVVVIINYSRNPLILIQGILEWMQTRHTDHGPDPVAFEVEILDSKTVDISFTLELSEDIRASKSLDGTSLSSIPECTTSPNTYEAWAFTSEQKE